MDLIRASLGLDVAVSILNSLFYIVDDDQCVIFFDHFFSVIKDAIDERSDLIDNFL